MTQIIIALSKYIFTALIALFVLVQLVGLKKRISESMQKNLYSMQVFILILFHLLGYLVLYYMTKDFDYLLFYAFQVLIFFAFIVFSRILYPKSNRFIINDMLFLFCIGMIILTRLSFSKSVKQFVIGSVCFFGCLIVPVLVKKFKFLSSLSGFYGVLGLGLLGMVYAFGAVTHGSKIRYEVFGISFQPSELVKILFIFYLACVFKEAVNAGKLILASVIACAHCLVLVLSKDLGSGMIFFVIFICMLYAGTKKVGYLLLGLATSGGAAFVAYKLFSHVQVRFTAWIDPWTKIDNESYQIAQSLFAICSGKWFGMGLNQGSPKSIPYVEADFVFSAIAQELGVVFSICLILLYLVFFLTIFKMAKNVKNNFYRLLAIGTGISIIFQVFLTIGGGVKFIPSTGVTLPLISYGGTSVISTVIMFSVLLGVSLVEKEEESKGYIFGYEDGYEAGSVNGGIKAMENQFDTVLMGEDGVAYGFNYDDFGFAYDVYGTIYNQKGYPCDQNGLILQRQFYPNVYASPVVRAFMRFKQTGETGIVYEEEKPVSNIFSNMDCNVLMASFAVLFLVMSGYIGNYVKHNDVELVSNDYNPVQAILMKQNYRGSIYDRNGNELAYTKVSNGEETRVYPYGELFAHAVGYSTKGKSGIESLAQAYLIQCNSSLNTKVEAEKKDQKNPGDNVYTTLDADLQEVAKNALGLYRGAVIVTEVDTGEILCMYSNPGFDPNEIEEKWTELSNDKSSTVLLNRVTQGIYPPGSTFKICTAMEYIQENENSYNNYHFNCNGKLSNASGTIHCYHGSNHGAEDFDKSFAKSCNSSFANIGLSLNRKDFGSTLKKLMFNSDLPLDIPYTKSKVSMDADTSEYDCMQTSIGQGTTYITPIHLNMITCAIANNGILMKPHLLTDVKTAKGDLVKTFDATEYGRLMDSDVALELQHLMEGVVQSGTGTKLQNSVYSAAGKTGSAEYNSVKEDSHAWFTGFAPVESPKIAVTVIVEGAGSGGDFAVPITKRIMDAYFAK